jgi:hypothetical protein
MQTLEGFYKEAISFNMRRDLSAALAQHTPTEFHKLISEIYEYKREEALTARNEEIAETENAPDRDPIRMLGNAFDIGG